MAKISPSKPVLITFYGFPGSGKSYLARNLTDDVSLALVSADRIRGELFANPRYDKQENAIIQHLMNYMAEEFLKAGVGVVFDTDMAKAGRRRRLAELAKKHNARQLVVWIQVDPETSFLRTQQRDRRTADDKFAQPLDRKAFDSRLSEMQNPGEEEYIVVSGKHAYVSQKNAIVNWMYRHGLINSGTVQSNVQAKPGLVNLVPNAGRVDFSRRNISIN